MRRRPRSLPRALLPVAVAGAAIVCAVQGLDRPSGASAPAGGSPPTGAPVLTPARVPVAGAQLAADERLGVAIDAVLGGPPASSWQACAQVDDAGVPVYVRNGAVPLVPASNVKLLTAAAVLDRLGPSATFTTTAVAAGPPADGVVAGPLYLVGGGDPLLATDAYRSTQRDWTESREPITRLGALADAVRAAGITRVGGVTGDDSRYDGERTIPTWSASYLSSGQVARVSALEVDGGTFGSGGRRVPVADPALSAATTFATLLRQRGIAVGGPARHAPAPAGGVTVAAVRSPPLTTVIGEMLRESDNLAAEMLVKELGVRAGAGGTWAAGIPLVRAALAAAGIPVEGVVQLDGSGLDRGDRVPCRTLAAIASQGALEPEFPVAARCGTLVKRLVGQPAGQRLVAKTGSLIGVVGLSGAVSPAPLPSQPCPPAGAMAEPVTFSLLLNGTPSASLGEGVADRVANVLAIYAGGA